jgi:hypothetical protein
MADEEECTLNGVTVLQANRVGVAISLAISFAFLAATVLTIAKFGAPHGKDGASFINVMMFGMIGGGIGAYYFGRLSRKPSDLAGELRATRNGVYVRGKRLVARREIGKAYLWPGSGNGALVRIERKGLLAGPIDLKVKTVEEGRALLHALGLDATQSASEFSVAGVSRGHFRKRLYTCWAGTGTAFALLVLLGILKAKLGIPNAVAGGMGFTAGLLYIGSILQMVAPAKVVVGADGVYLKWLWQKRFVAIEDIERAEIVEGDPMFNGVALYVRLVRKSGEPVDLFVQSVRSNFGGMGFNKFVRMRAEILAERINEAVDGKSRGVKGSSSALAWDGALLSRGERAIEEWVAALRGLRAKAETFREPGAVLDQLWGVLEDAQAAPEKRAAAAVALSPHLDDGGRERLRLAAQATVAPKLRIALEAAAEDDDDRLVRALDDVAAPHARVAT